jgi:hypothetical protein
MNIKVMENNLNVTKRGLKLMKKEVNVEKSVKPAKR